MSQFVMWFDSSETGAPVLNNANGSMIAVLDACLVTGFNNKAVQSIAVAGGVATVSCASHGYVAVHGKDVLISGATPAELNGRKEVLTVTANSFTYASASPAGSATGTITVRRDALGFVKAHTGVNKAIYRRSDVTASAMMLRVEDIGANSGVNASLLNT